MQTFLPYADFNKSALVLDNKRLNKQRVEAWQIYLALTEKNYGWKNHPCVKMWKGYERMLAYYGWTICNEWIKRGYKDTLMIKFYKEIVEAGMMDITPYPKWLGNRDFHDAMKSNLLRKDKKYYSQFGWKVADNLPYIWGTE